MSALEEFLKNKAQELHSNRTIMEYEVYKEDEEAHYKDNLEWDCSWLHHVGVLALIDGNKFDFCRLYIGIVDQDDECQFIGCLYFSDGENMDLDRLLRRAVNQIKECHSIFTEE